jgi:hypothetical protein
MITKPVGRIYRKARAAHRGLWADAKPVAPWEWRAGEKDRKRVPSERYGYMDRNATI